MFRPLTTRLAWPSADPLARSLAVPPSSPWLLEPGHAADHRYQRELLCARTVRFRNLTDACPRLPPSAHHLLRSVHLMYSLAIFSCSSFVWLARLTAGTIYEQSIGLSSTNSRILAAANGTEYFLASWIAVFFIERLGVSPSVLCAEYPERSLMPSPSYAPATKAHDLRRGRPVHHNGAPHRVRSF